MTQQLLFQKQAMKFQMLKEENDSNILEGLSLSHIIN